MAGKARVHELAKELGVTSKELLATLKEQGEFVKSASSTVEGARRPSSAGVIPVGRRSRNQVRDRRSRSGGSPRGKARRTVAVGCKAWRTASRPQAGRTRTGCSRSSGPGSPRGSRSRCSGSTVSAVSAGPHPDVQRSETSTAGTSGSGCSRSVGTGSPRGSGRTVHRRKARRTASGTEGTSRR